MAANKPRYFTSNIQLMSLSRTRAVRPRAESDDDERSVVASSDASPVNESDLEEAGAEDEDSQSSVSNKDEESGEDLKDVSFGLLAEAQARLNPNPRKRKITTPVEEPNDEPSEHVRNREDERRRDKQDHISRSSKHAPTVMSTRNPVSRRREIFSPPPAAKFRDPRFDATVIADARRDNTSSTQRATKNYSFLTEYQAKEVLDLKSQMKKTKDSDQQAKLKRQIMSVEAKIRNVQTQQREAEILQEHKRKEREAISQGRKSKPYYLKPSELKKQINQERLDAMGKRARDKSDKRKKKREKTKESRDMPRQRRFVE